MLRRAACGSGGRSGRRHGGSDRGDEASRGARWGMIGTVRHGCEMSHSGRKPTRYRTCTIRDLGPVLSDEQSGSGGGTRTPDTRIMIPLL